MKRIGITGLIGSGKSVVSKILILNHISVYDSDKNAKRIMTEDPAVKEEIKKCLGNNSYRGQELDRTFIAGIIFNNKEKLEELNHIVHPAVWKDFENWSKKEERNDAKAVAFESAIMYKSGLNKKFDTIWIVKSTLENRINRACKRDHTNPEKIKERIKNQTEPIDSQANIIYNDEKISLIEQVKSLIEKL